MSRNKVIFDVLANDSQYKRQMASVEKTTDKTSKAIAASFAVTAASLGGSLAAFAKYETGLIKVGKTADLQGKELKAFGKEITNLSGTIPLSTRELLDLASSAAQLGVKGKDNIIKFTETVAKLGTATDIVGEEGSRAIARLLNITGEGVQTVDKFAAIITRLGNNVAASESEILSMASRVGKATAQFELGTTAVLGISAALKEVGVEAELGGSAIGRAFVEIQNAVFKGGESLDTFSKITGLTGDELKQTFEKDATGAFQLFIEALNKLPAEQVVASMEAMGLKGVRLREVIGTLAKRSDLLARSLSLASDEAQRQTALNEEFSRAVGSLENSFKFMKNEVFNLAKSMGQDLAPAAKEIIEDITGIIKGIREFNERTGGAVTTSIVLAAKVSALVIAFNKLKNILIATGIISATMAKSMGEATFATTKLGIASNLASIKNQGLAASFGSVATASKSALLAIKNFQVGLGALVGGLVIAIDLGKKLGDIIGDLGNINTSEEELVKTRSILNNLLAIRVKLEEKVATGDQRAAERLEKLNQEIAKHEGLIKVLEREVETRKKANQPPETPTMPEMDIAAGEAPSNEAFKTTEEEKTAILSKEIEARIAATQREAELLSEINKGMSAESVRLAEERNKQLEAIEKKKLELDRVNQDLARTNIDENEKSILELKRSAIEQELILMDEKFNAQQEKTAEQEAKDMEARIVGKQLLNQALTEQEAVFLEEKRAKDQENRDLDLEIKAVRDEEDLALLQNKLITEEQAKDAARKEELNRIAAAHNTKLMNEARFGKAIGGMQTFFQSEQVKGVQTTLASIQQIKTKDGSAAAKAQKAFAIADTAIKIPQAAFAAYTSLASIPIIGPALGAAAAAAAVVRGTQDIQAIKSQPTPSYAVGTDFVPKDTLAQIHQGEGIIPAKQNQFLQSGDLVLGSPDIINNNDNTSNNNNTNIINVNFDGSNFIGNIGDDEEIINQIFEGIAVGIDEGRLAGFEQSNLSVTRQ